MPVQRNEHLMEIVGVRLDGPSARPIVVLREAAGVLHVPICVSPREATLIVFALQDVDVPALLGGSPAADVSEDFSRTVVKVCIDGIDAAVFHAFLFFDDGGVIDSPISGAIALAAQSRCPVFCSSAVLNATGAVVTGECNMKNAEHLVGEFCNFLDQIGPEDFMT